MGVSFNKSGELNVSSYLNIPFRSSALINNINVAKYCFIWSISASLHPCNTKRNRISN